MTHYRDVKGALAPVAAAETEEAPPSDRTNTSGKKKTFFLSITNRYVYSLLSTHLFRIFCPQIFWAVVLNFFWSVSVLNFRMSYFAIFHGTEEKVWIMRTWQSSTGLATSSVFNVQFVWLNRF